MLLRLSGQNLVRNLDLTPCIHLDCSHYQTSVLLKLPLYWYMSQRHLLTWDTVAQFKYRYCYQQSRKCLTLKYLQDISFSCMTHALFGISDPEQRPNPCARLPRPIDWRHQWCFHLSLSFLSPWLYKLLKRSWGKICLLNQSCYGSSCELLRSLRFRSETLLTACS